MESQSTETIMTPPSLMKVPARAWMLAVAMSVATSAQPQSPPPAKNELKAGGFGASQGVFRTFGSGSDGLSELGARLKDPQERAKMRAEHRESIAASHYGVADALQLDAATLDKLIELLTDQQMTRSEAFYRNFSTRAPASDPRKEAHAEAERMTRQINAQREVLGQEKFERYQALQPSLGRRTQVRELEERFGEADKLSGAQRERLVELLHEELTKSIEQSHPLHFRRATLAGSLSDMPSPEELQRTSQLQAIRVNEETWRERPESNRELRESAAEFLTERQLAMLAQLHAEELASLQQRIEQMRVEAGLSPTIPEQPQVVEVRPQAVTRDVKVSLKVAVDDESPRYLATVVTSGKTVSLKVSEVLVLEATPVVFDNDFYMLHLEYFETGVTGKRSIGSSGQGGQLKPQDPQMRAFQINHGGGTSVLAGSKGYAVELSAFVEAT
jgi:hypothetical protein